MSSTDDARFLRWAHKRYLLRPPKPFWLILFECAKMRVPPTRQRVQILQQTWLTDPPPVGTWRRFRRWWEL